VRAITLSVPFLVNVGLLTMLFTNFLAHLFVRLNDFITSFAIAGLRWSRLVVIRLF